RYADRARREPRRRPARHRADRSRQPRALPREPPEGLQGDPRRAAPDPRAARRRGRDLRRAAFHAVRRRRPDRRAPRADPRAAAGAAGARAAGKPARAGRPWRCRPARARDRRRGPRGRRPRRPAMSATLPAKLALARIVGALSRLRGGGATSAPGKALLRLQPDAIAQLGARLQRGSVLISATNGKTTTATMAAAILRGAGSELVYNSAGANMAGGIASTLLQAAGPRGSIAGELGLFEVDEFWLARLTDQLRPRAILLGNLFRDQ